MMSARKRMPKLVARDRKTEEETLSAGSKSGPEAPISSSKKPNKGDVRPGVNTPRFRCRQEGELELVAFKEARVVKSSRRATAAAKADIIVHREAVQCMRREGGDPADKVAVLGSFELQFGQY
eukprot:XP_011665515.1 PREDICTED: uncharacterized protein LOC105438868 [Strongylocentrotus purpuratus]